MAKLHLESMLRNASFAPGSEERLLVTQISNLKSLLVH